MALSLTCKKFLRLTLQPNQNYLRHRFFFGTCSFEKKGLVLGVYYDKEDCKKLALTPSAEKYNELTGGKLFEQIKLSGNKIKPGKCRIFWGLCDGFQSVAVVGLGKQKKKFDDLELICDGKESIRIAAGAACKCLDAAGIKNITVENLGDAEAAAEGSKLSTWKFQEFKTEKDKLPEVHPFCAEDKPQWDRGIIRAESQNIARRFADTPSNLMTPTMFVEKAQELLSGVKDVTMEVRDQKWAESEKMGAFLAVAKGSCEPPKFVELSFNRSNGQTNPFVLIGKGVTFDAGGISLKPAAGMQEMRADMSGAACVLATMYGLSKLCVQANVKVLIPLVENMPSGTAIKPGDVITARNGKTICVDNTDAEGRLILADALSYSEKFKPKWVLDIATLTGAMRVALGGAATGVFTNSNSLYQSLEEAGVSSGDRVWRFPLWKFYTKMLTEYDAYDINNIGKPAGGGSCTAAAFLKEFIPKEAYWMHLDIAGVMGPDDPTPYLTKGMTGRPTRTLIKFIEEQSKIC